MSRFTYLILLAMLAGTGVLLGSKAFLLLGLAGFAALLVSFAIVVFSRERLVVRMHAPATVEKGKSVCFTPQIQSKGLLPVGKICIRYVMENKLTGEKQSGLWNLNQTTQLDTVSRYCGCLEFLSEAIWVYDWFGVFRLPLKQELKKSVLIMPDTFSVPIDPVRSISNQDDCLEYSQEQKGNDLTEIFQVREYVPGDNIRTIHWKLSGKMDALYVRDASLPIDDSLMVFCDRSPDYPTAACGDALMEAVVSVCQELTDMGLSFRLIWNEDLMQDWEVKDPEHLPEAVSELLKGSRSMDPRSAYERFTEKRSLPEGSRILYFCDSLGLTIPASGFLDVFYMTEASGGDAHVHFLHPERLEEDLYEALWQA